MNIKRKLFRNIDDRSVVNMIGVKCLACGMARPVNAWEYENMKHCDACGSKNIGFADWKDIDEV